MKRRAFYVIFLLLIFNACSKIQAPEFKNITDLSVDTIDTLITITGNGLFYNPNKSKIVLRSADIDVFINDQLFTRINNEYNLTLTPEKEFSIPLVVKLNHNQVENFLKKNAVGLLLGNGIQLKYKGNIRVKAFSMKIKVPVNKEISLRLKNFL